MPARLDVLHGGTTGTGFRASAEDVSNHGRVRSRDGVVMGPAGLLSGDDPLRAAEIPSNVDTQSRRVSHGGTAGRVDADPRFIIDRGEYWRATGDEDFPATLNKSVEAARFPLGAWEFNTRGL